MPTYPGSYIEMGVVLGTVITAWVGFGAFMLGRFLGARTALAARTMQDARIMRAEAEQQWTVGQQATMVLPVLPAAVGQAEWIPRSARPTPKSRR